MISVVELEGARPRLDSEILPQNGLGRDTGQKEKNREKKNNSLDLIFNILFDNDVVIFPQDIPGQRSLSGIKVQGDTIFFFMSKRDNNTTRTCFVLGHPGKF